MRIQQSALIITSLAGMLLTNGQATAADVRKFCYKIASGMNDAYIRGDVFREALRTSTLDKWNSASKQPLPTVPPPHEATQCSGASAAPAAGPQRDNYLGNITTKAKFLRMAATACLSKPTITDQYFSIGDAIYYRNCNAGAQVGYIHFWGLPDGKKSQCFGSTYPEMFQAASPPMGQPTQAQMRAIYDNKGAVAMASQLDYALGNAMAAIQIAEAARDYLVYPINYMLIEQNKAAEQIIGGHFPQGLPNNECQNRLSPQNGAHPLGWGGAQAAMMTGGWGTSNGAMSDYGMQFEAQTTIDWLSFKKLIEREKLPTNGTSQCAANQNYNMLPQSVKNSLRDFFAPVFN